MKGLAWTLFVLSVCLLIFLVGFGVIRGYLFNYECGGYLKLAADAPTVERANGFLVRAVSYLDKTGRTHGNSAVIFKTPGNDVGIWYAQIMESLKTTEEIIKKGSGASQLERDNALMKIRETLLDVGESGTELTHPAHIAIVPYQVAIVVLWLVFLFMSIGCGVAMFKVYA
jgi:hypothetical protein